MPSNKPVRFLMDFRPKGQAEDIPNYKMGEERQLESSYADKYVRLGIAEFIDAKTPMPTVHAPAGPKFDPKVEIPNNWNTFRPAGLMELAKSLSGKNSQSGQAASIVITDALIERSEPIVMRSEQNGEDRKVYALQPWPTYSTFDADLLKNPSGGLEVQDNDITITLANGIASYRIVAVKDNLVIAALVESTFEEAPTQ